MFGFGTKRTEEPPEPIEPPAPEPEPEPLPAPEGMPPEPPDLPPVPPPPPPNNPLAVMGTFARPGTAAAVPFRTGDFMRDRYVGSSPQLRFGAGSSLAGLQSPVPTQRSDEPQDDLLRALLRRMS